MACLRSVVWDTCKVSSSSRSTSRLFSCSLPLEAKAKRDKARAAKKRNLEVRASQQRTLEATKPDPIWGSRGGFEQGTWRYSHLYKLTLRPQTAWATIHQSDVNDYTSEKSKYLSSVPVEERRLLFEALPQVSTAFVSEQVSNRKPPPPLAMDHSSNTLTDPYKALYTLHSPTKASDLEVRDESTMNERLQGLEQSKREYLARIISLSTASSAGINMENRARIVQSFGREQGDTGSSEVQAALLTYQIWGLGQHLRAHTRDIHNRRALRTLVHQRQKVLKYLKRKDLPRYVQTLKRIGVEDRAIEGEIHV